MEESTTNPASQVPEPDWTQYNYPPLIRLMHFRPSQLPSDRKALVLMLFSLHPIGLIVTLINLICNCIQVNITILYGILFFIIFNPIILFLFYRAYMGLCREKSKLTLYFFIQPVIIIVQVVISIIGYIGFNGIIKIVNLFENSQVVAALFALITTFGFLGMAIFSTYLYVRVWKQRSILTKLLV